MDINGCVAFNDYMEMSKQTSNKVGFLTMVFQRLHTTAPEDDSNNTGGRIAKLWALCHKDTGYLLQIIWCTSAKPCNGSHLNYIQAVVNKTKLDRQPTARPVTPVNLRRAN